MGTWPAGWTSADGSFVLIVEIGDIGNLGLRLRRFIFFSSAVGCCWLSDVSVVSCLLLVEEGGTSADCGLDTSPRLSPLSPDGIGVTSEGEERFGLAGTLAVPVSIWAWVGAGQVSL